MRPPIGNACKAGSLSTIRPSDVTNIIAAGVKKLVHASEKETGEEKHLLFLAGLSFCPAPLSLLESLSESLLPPAPPDLLLAPFPTPFPLPLYWGRRRVSSSQPSSRLSSPPTVLRGAGFLGFLGMTNLFVSGPALGS